MSRDLITGPFRHGLTFIATLAFVASFFGSRLFATLFPTTVVMQDRGLHPLAGYVVTRNSIC
jgi:hypothetical protein